VSTVYSIDSVVLELSSSNASLPTNSIEQCRPSVVPQRGQSSAVSSESGKLCKVWYSALMLLSCICFVHTAINTVH